MLDLLIKKGANGASRPAGLGHAGGAFLGLLLSVGHGGFAGLMECGHFLPGVAQIGLEALNPDRLDAQKRSQAE